MEVSKVPLNFWEHPESEMVVQVAGFRDELVKGRSDRDFSDRLMPSGVLEARLAAAVTAPNGANLQP
jgi:iodotyrosine deiodinase